MNRVDRLFAITTRLLSRRTVRAEELAAEFEVSRRTIYRDIAALSESGVPVVSLPGQGYAIADGYTLPPLMLTEGEATALVIGARLVIAESRDRLQEAARRAADKILAIVSEATRAPLADIERAIDFAGASTGVTPLDLANTRIHDLMRAIIDRRVIVLRYVSRKRGEITIRAVEPNRLHYADGTWFLTGYCRLRAAERAFRVDRIETLTVLPEQFRPRPVMASPTEVLGVKVQIQFDEPAARWVRERQHWTWVGEAPSARGVVFTYAPPSLEDLVLWILGWGAAARVLSPPELRDRLRSEARAMLEMLT